jgi:Domain of unknown function (DUF4384)
MFAKFSFVLAVGLVSGAAAQDQPQLTARELFYAAVSVPPKSAPKKAVPARKPPAPLPLAKTIPPDAPIVPAVASISAAGTLLGLKYTILQSSAQGTAEVPSDTPFHAGDRIQLSVEANSAGYLYVISQGSSGAWKPMFPSPEVAEGDNRVEPFHQYLLPPKSRMLFDEQAGEEKLFIVFSREPEASLEKMIYSLQDGAPRSAPSPARKTLVSAGDPTIDNHTVGILRAAYSRDLLIEKVEASTDTQKKETAVYVVNPSGSPDSRLVADLRLAHR